MKNRKCRILLIISLVISMMLPTSILAEGETPAPEPSVQISGGISISNSVVYTGSSYSIVSSNNLSASGGAYIQYSVNNGAWADLLDEVSSAGDYTLQYRAFLDDDHIDGPYTAGTFTIQKAPNDFHTLPIANTDFQFDGNSHPLYSNTPDAVCGGAISYTWYKDGVYQNTINSVPSIKDAGTYTISCSTSNSTINYKSVSSETSTIKVSPKPITATLTAKSLTYNGSSQSSSVLTFTPSEGGSDATYEIVSGGSGTNAGAYKLKIKGTGNYSFTSEADWTIDKLDITGGTANLEDAVLYYTGNPQTQKVNSITVGGATLTSNDYTVTNATQTNVGTYTLTVSGKDPNTTGSITKQYEIKPFVITQDNVDIILGPSLTYNENEQTQTVAQVKVKATGAVVDPSLYTVTNNKRTNAGDYTLTITGNGGNVTGSATKQFSIAKKVVTGTWTGSPFEYDGREHEVRLTGLPSCATVTLSGTYKATQPGTYKANATITITGNDNYVAGTVPAYNWSIKRPVYNMSGVSFESKSFAYDGKPHSLAISGNLPAGVTVEYINNSLTKVGAITVTAVFHGDSFHDPIPNMTATLRVVNQLIDEPVPNTDRLVYDGKEKSILDKYKENKNYTIEGDSQIEPGKYKVIVKLNNKKSSAWKSGKNDDLEFELVIYKPEVTGNNVTITDKINGFDPDSTLLVKYSEKEDNSGYTHIVPIDELLDGHREFIYGYLAKLQLGNTNLNMEGETTISLPIPVKYKEKEFEIIHVNNNKVSETIKYEISKDGKFAIIKVKDLGEFIFTTVDNGHHVHILKIITILASLLFTLIYYYGFKKHKMDVLVVLAAIVYVVVYLYLGYYKNCHKCLVLDIIALISLLYMLYRFLKKNKEDDEENKANTVEFKEEEKTVEDTEKNISETKEEMNESSTKKVKEDSAKEDDEIKESSENSETIEEIKEDTTKVDTKKKSKNKKKK